MAGFGAFGKMPALGDFFRLSLPPGFAEPWDTWVQDGLLAAQAGLADRWQACFFSAPIWRFSLAPGLAGPAPVQGVLMASVDRVGRQFPLTLVAPLAGAAHPDVVAAHLSAGRTFAELEDLALDALEDDMTRDRMANRLSAIVPALAPPTAKMAGTAPGRALAWRGASDLAEELAKGPGAAGHAHPSIWTAVLQDETLLYLQDGLPPPARMCDFYDSGSVLWQAALTEGAPP